MKQTNFIFFWLACFFLVSCANPNFHFVPATLVFEDRIIPREIQEAPLFRLGTFTDDSEWNAKVEYTGSTESGFMIPAISVFDFRTVEFFVSESSAIVELHITYAPFRINPENVIADLENKIGQPPSTETITHPSRIRIIPTPPPKHTYIATWTDSKTVLQVEYNDFRGDVVIKIIDQR